MATISRAPLGSKCPSPPSRLLPSHAQESNSHLHRVSCHDALITPIMTYGFIVDSNNLDLDLLISSFQQLVKHWPILGSVLVRDVNGDLAYSPLSHTTTQPGFTSSILTFPDPISSHFPIPTSSSTPLIHPNPPCQIFQPQPPLLHSSCTDYITASQPLVHLQFTSFSDATCIGFTAPHIFCDAGGAREIIHAWSQIVANFGNAESIPRVIDDTLLLEKIGKKRVGRRDGDIPEGMYVYPVSEASPRLLAPKDAWEWKWVSIPNEMLKKLKNKVMDELKERGSEEWVSEGDVLLAWWAKTIYHGNADQTPIDITVPIDLRSKLSEVSHAPYIHNALHSVSVNYPSLQILSTTSLTSISLDIRHAIQSATEEEIRDILAFKTRVYYSKADHSIVATHIPKTSARMTVSNWLKMGLGNSTPDFSAAIKSGATKGSGKVIWVDSSNQPGPSPRPVGMAVRKDENAVWIRFGLPRNQWVNVERILAEKYNGSS